MITLDARLTALSSPDLLAALELTAGQGREVTADLIALLAECDARQLYAAEGYASLFEFCVARLRLSEAQAYHRIQAARAARRFPLVLERVREGRVTLTAVALLRQHLTEDNHREVLDWVDGRGKREVEMFVRRLDPKPDVPSSVRRLAPPCARPPAAHAAEHQGPGPAPGRETCGPSESQPPTAPSLPLLVATPPAPAETGGVDSAPLRTSEGPAAPGGVALVGTPPPLVGPASARRAEIRPLAPARYSLHVTISEETHDKLRQAQHLLCHTIPTADLALVLDRALTLLVAQLERRKAGAPAKPQHASRPTRQATTATCQPHASVAAEDLGPAPGHGTDDASNFPAPEDAGRPRKARKARSTRPAAEPPPSPSRRSRYIPVAVRRAVWARSQGRCEFVGESGQRCGARAFLEFHHRVPFSTGGASSVTNIMVHCARHNSLEAKRSFNSARAEFEGRAPGVSQPRVWSVGA